MLKTAVMSTAVMSTAVMSSKGQVVIPAALRKRFDMKEGTRIIFEEKEGQLVMKTVNWDAILALRGSLSYDLEGDLIAERALEAKREEERFRECEPDKSW